MCYVQLDHSPQVKRQTAEFNNFTSRHKKKVTQKDVQRHVFSEKLHFDFISHLKTEAKLEFLMFILLKYLLFLLVGQNNTRKQDIFKFLGIQRAFHNN